MSASTSRESLNAEHQGTDPAAPSSEPGGAPGPAKRGAYWPFVVGGALLVAFGSGLWLGLSPASARRSAAAPATSDATAAASYDFAALEQQFRHEPNASTESQLFREEVRKELGRMEASSGLGIEALECRLRMCKIVLTFPSLASDLQVIQSIFIDGSTPAYPRGFGGFIASPRVHLPNGRIQTTVYLARESDLNVAMATR